jgi:DNA-binding transcriptional LysR family regulator
MQDMQPIDNFDLRLFDLNLLVAFDALMRERSVTKAAERMRVGQPAMSHSLATLRLLLQDELLVRVGNAMEPTRRALLIHDRVAEGLMALQGAVRLSESFEPAREERTFRLGFSSDVEFVLMPQLTARLREQAPSIRTVGHLVGSREVERLIDDGELDVAIGCFAPHGNRFRIRKLCRQELTCVWHPDQLALELPLTRERYLEAAHVAMTLDDNLRGCLDAALSATGETLNIVAASAQFLSVLSIVASAPVLATLPSGVARLHAGRFGLHMTTPPLDLRLPPISLLWGVRLDLDPGAAWLRDEISRLLRPPDGLMAV